MLVSRWLDARNDRRDLFSLDHDSNDSLLGFAIAVWYTAEDIRALLTDELLSDEFLAVWRPGNAPGNVRAPGVVSSERASSPSGIEAERVARRSPIRPLVRGNLDDGRTPGLYA